MSMLPVELRGSRSNLPSRKRWVVSSWVSTTMEEKCSFLARAEISPAVIDASSKDPAEMQSPTLRNVRSSSILIFSTIHRRLYAAHRFPPEYERRGEFTLEAIQTAPASTRRDLLPRWIPSVEFPWGHRARSSARWRILG